MTALMLNSFCIYCSVPHIHPPSHISPPYIFSRSSYTGIFISQIGPLNHGHATKIATWSFVETPTLSSSRSLWWSGNARTKPASADQLRNSPTIASVSTSGVSAIAHWTNPRSAWKTPTSVSRSWPSNFWRTREAKADSGQLRQP